MTGKHFYVLKTLAYKLPLGDQIHEQKFQRTARISMFIKI